MSRHRPSPLLEITADDEEARGGVAEEAATSDLESTFWVEGRATLGSPSDSTVPAFLPGERAAGRFRIVGLVGQGGMGQVFEAYDEELSTRVALKVVRPEISHSRRAMDLFKQEVQLARQVTHPNVCRIFDFFLHDPGKTDWGKRRQEMCFLTMEFLEGETLARHSRSARRLSSEEVREWTQQLVHGLAAMHQVGITHRDLKPENILLVPGDSGLRPVITDFGLAVTDRGQRKEAASPTAGTPAYSAPEQKAGKIPTPAADVYSFGLILLELLESAESAETSSGRPPAGTVEDRLHRLRSPWVRVLRRCLAEEPGDRYADAKELRAALSLSKMWLPKMWPPKMWPQRVLGIAAALGLVIVTILVLDRRLAPGPEGSSTVSPVASSAKAAEPIVVEPLVTTPRPTLVITPFSASNPGDSWLAEALWAGAVEVFQTRLDLRLLQGPPSATSFGDELQEASSAELFLTASVTRPPDGGAPRLQWTLTSSSGDAPPHHQTLVLRAHPGILRGIGDLVEGVGAQLEALGWKTFPNEPAKIEAALSGFPKNETALRALAEAHLDLRKARPKEALEKLRKAEVLEPDAWAVSLARAEAQASLGFDRRAAAAAERAFQLARAAPPEIRDRLEALYRTRQGKWRDAIEIYRRLWARYPDDAAYGLALAEARLFGESVIATRQTLDKLAQAPATPLERLQEALLRAHLHRLDGELQAQGEFARTAADLATLSGTPILLLEALFLEADSLLLGQDPIALEKVRQRYAAEVAQGTWTDLQLAQAILVVTKVGGQRWNLPLGPSLEKAKETFRASGNLRDHSRIQVQQALILGQESSTRPEALALAEDTLQEARRAGSPQALAEAHRAVAILHHLEANPIEAARHFDSAVEQAREVGKIVLLGGALHNHAIQLHRIGKLGQAQERFAEAEALFHASGEQRGRIMALLESGSLLAELGDLPGAVAKLEEARREARSLDNASFLAMATERLAYTRELQGKASQATRLFEKGLELYDSLRPDAGLRTRIYLAYRDEESTTVEAAKVAEAQIRRLLEQETIEPGPYFQILARTYLARVLLLQGRPSEAAQLLKIEDDDLVHARDRSLAFEVARALALLESAQGRTDDAVERLQDRLAIAEANGSVLHQLELRLLLGRILKKGGRSEAAASQLESVTRQAEELGFVELARKARLVPEAL